jgi:hypothetical protein
MTYKERRDPGIRFLAIVYAPPGYSAPVFTGTCLASSPSRIRFNLCNTTGSRSVAQSTLGTVPPEAAGQFGPHLTALIAYLTVVCRMPRLRMRRDAGVGRFPIG